MRILYGVCGEGMGHAIRATVIGKHLLDRGHDVVFASSGGALRHLSTKFPHRTVATIGLSAVVYQNKVQKAASLALNVLKQLTIGTVNTFASIELFFRFKPALVISDFELVSAQYAALLQVPFIAVGNIEFASRCSHPRNTLGEAPWIARTVTDIVTPLADHYLVTSLFKRPIIKPHTSLHPAIIKPEIQHAKTQAITASSGPVVCYFNSKSNHDAIASALKQSRDTQFILYGRPNVTSLVRDENVTWAPFSEHRMTEHVSQAQAVIGGAGFTFMSEAVYLGKPMLAVPYEGNYEQELNAHYLRMHGLGAYAKTPDPSSVKLFLRSLDSMRDRLAKYNHDDNRGLLKRLDSEINRAIARGNPWLRQEWYT